MNSQLAVAEQRSGGRHVLARHVERPRAQGNAGRREAAQRESTVDAWPRNRALHAEVGRGDLSIDAEVDLENAHHRGQRDAARVDVEVETRVVFEGERTVDHDLADRYGRVAGEVGAQRAVNRQSQSLDRDFILVERERDGGVSVGRAAEAQSRDGGLARDPQGIQSSGSTLAVAHVEVDGGPAFEQTTGEFRQIDTGQRGGGLDSRVRGDGAPFEDVDLGRNLALSAEQACVGGVHSKPQASLVDYERGFGGGAGVDQSPDCQAAARRGGGGARSAGEGPRTQSVEVRWNAERSSERLAVVDAKVE